MSVVERLEWQDKSSIRIQEDTRAGCHKRLDLEENCFRSMKKMTQSLVDMNTEDTSAWESRKIDLDGPNDHGKLKKQIPGRIRWSLIRVVEAMSKAEKLVAEGDQTT